VRSHTPGRTAFHTIPGQSRQFAFVQFVGIPEATQFLNKYYPAVHLYGNYDPAESGNVESIKARIAYSREKDDRDRTGKGDDDWTCEVVGAFPSSRFRGLSFA